MSEYETVNALVAETAELLGELERAGRCPRPLNAVRLHDLLLGKLGPQNAPDEKTTGDLLDLLSNPLVGVLRRDGADGWIVAGADGESVPAREEARAVREVRPLAVRQAPTPQLSAPAGRGHYASILARLRALGQLTQVTTVSGAGSGWRTLYALRSPAGKKAHVFLRASKRHVQAGRSVYWYGILKPAFEALRAEGPFFIVFVLADSDHPYIVSADTLAPGLTHATTDRRGDWKLKLYAEPGVRNGPADIVISGSRGHRIDLAPYRDAWTHLQTAIGGEN